MTERLYYHDSFLLEFSAKIKKFAEHDGRAAIVLDKTAFYPTSGGQLFDTGSLEVDGHTAAVTEVAEDESGEILHLVAQPGTDFKAGTEVRGKVDAERRRDHMQQHSGQHVLSAAFVELFEIPTVSFHMGAESCTIDLAAPDLTTAQLEKAEELANRVVTDDRSVEVRFATADQARQMGVRKLPPFDTEGGKYRLVDIQNFDLTACGGTHANRTGQIGAILLRKVEKVKQGMRVEFVCGARSVHTSRRDYATLTDAAGTYSTHIWEVPGQIKKSLEAAKAADKKQHALLEELAELRAAQMLAEAAETQGTKVVAHVFADREVAFVKLVAQKIAKHQNAVALLASTAGEPTLVFAQSPGLPFNMGTLMKQAMAELGGRGGGSKDFAQGGVGNTAGLESYLAKLASGLKA